MHPIEVFFCTVESVKMNRLQNTPVRGMLAKVAALGAIAVSGASNAAIDVSSATTAISDGSTAMLSVLGAIIGVVAVVWAMRKVISLFGK